MKFHLLNNESRLISLDRCEGEARVSSRKGKVINNTEILFNKDLGKVSSVLLFTLKIRCSSCMIGVLWLLGKVRPVKEVHFKESWRFELKKNIVILKLFPLLHISIINMNDHHRSRWRVSAMNMRMNRKR